MSLLVIEDLDGRLIYARAGDGEAVFGSDGEFEFADDSSDWWSSDDDDIEADNEDDEDDVGPRPDQPSVESDPLLLQPSAESSTAANNNVAGPSTAAPSTTAPSTTTTSKPRRNLTTSAESSLEPDEGETTDEFAFEEMPYPRLLVGSVAPKGSGTSRARARANAQAKRANNALAASASNPSINGKSHPPNSTMITTGAPGSSGSNSSSSSTVPGTPKIPSPSMAPGTLPSTPGASTVALVDPMATPSMSTLTSVPQPPSTPGASTSKVANNGMPLTPFRRPEMGTFIPSQDKAVHRAIIDGANKAPSPYQRGKDVMTRGLAPKRKHDESDGRSSRQRNERRAAASRGRSPMSMSSSRMNGGSNGANGSGSNGGSGSNVNMLGGGHSANGPSSSSSLPRRFRKKARTTVVDMDPGISLDELLDMELLSEGGLVQR